MRFLNPLDEHVETPLCFRLTLHATISEYVGLPQYEIKVDL